MTEIFSEISNSVTRYAGVDWLITLTVFAGVFLIGEKNSRGFLLGMLASFLGIIFSFQIGSLANAVASILMLAVYFRGWLRWRREKFAAVETAETVG